MAHRIHKINTEDTFVDLALLGFISAVGADGLAPAQFWILVDGVAITLTMDDSAEAEARQNQLKNAWEDYRLHGGVSVTQPIS